MSIAWVYLNKKKGTEDAIRDYPTMKFLIKQAEDAANREHDRMVGMRSPVSDGMPRTHNPGAFEDRMVNGIDNINEMGGRYRDAREYMDWFGPAWMQLSEEERDILELFYMRWETNIRDICKKYHIEKTTAYKRKDQALRHLRLLLFGIT